MPHSGFFGYCIPVGGRPVDPDFGIPEPPPVVGGGPILPPSVFPPVPPPGVIMPPIHYPPGGIAVPPIYIPDTPEKPITLPPGAIWPPLDPSDGLQGKYLVVVGIVGVGWRWSVIDTNLTVGLPLPPSAQPKR